MKKPLPPIARSVDEDVVSREPSEKSVVTELSCTPRPTWLVPEELLMLWYRASSKVQLQDL
jgi:hypothetical protein